MTRPQHRAVPAPELVRANDLRGLPCEALRGGAFPKEGKRCRKAVQRLGYRTTYIPSNGGQALAVVFDALGPETRVALLQQRAGIGPNGPPSDPARWEALTRAPAGVRREAERRLGIVREYRAHLDRGLGKMAAADAVKTPYNTLQGYLAPIEGVPPVDWMPALAPAWKPGGRQAECDQAAWDFFLGDYLHLNGPKLASAYKRAADYANREGLAWPSPDTIRRKLKRELSEAELVLDREGSKALANLYPPQHRDVTVYHANQAHNYDGIEPSVMVEWPDGHVGRASIFHCQDIYSKKLLGFQIDKTENSDQFRLVFGQVSETYGYPEDLYIDNTRAAANKQMSGGTRNRNRWKYREGEPLGTLPNLGIKLIFVTPDHGRAKPIERANRDLKEAIERDPRAAGAYSGDDPRQREGRASKPLPLSLFEEIVRDAITNENAKPGRRTQACKGRLSFDQAFAESYAKSPIRKALLAHRV